jgi:indolepyruvate decarboxylase
MSITIGQYLLARLSEMGVRYLFGVPGDFNLWFLKQTIKSGSIDFVGCCNELNASYAADGNSRLSGISALATTYGPGELSALAGVAGAYAERVPIVCITGTPPLGAMKEGTLLHHTMADGNYTNMLNCFREFTVAQARIEPANARLEIDRVLRACWIEKRPVYLQLPSDVAGVRTEPAQAPLDLDFPLSDPVQLARAIAKVSDRLLRASAPAFLVDIDAERFDLTQLIMLLAEANGIPMAHLIAAKGVIDETHPLAIGIYRGAASSPKVRQAIEGSDCLISVGARFTDVSSGLFTHQLNPKSVIDLQPFGLKTSNDSFNAVSAAELLSGLLQQQHRNGFAPVTVSRPLEPAEGRTPVSETKEAVTQEAFWSRVQAFLQPGNVLISDTGTAFFGTANLQLPEGVTYIGQPIWSSLGYGLPAALGACLASPRRRHLLFLGDGAFQMTAQELSTLLGRDLNPIIFLLNNDGYTIERLIYGAESSYNDLNPWRYGRFPAVVDARERTVTHCVRNHAELELAFEATSDTSRPHLIEIMLRRMDVPEPLVRFAGRIAEFDFPQLLEEQVDQVSRS